jgi:hypothetical protein
MSQDERDAASTIIAGVCIALVVVGAAFLFAGWPA